LLKGVKSDYLTFLRAPYFGRRQVISKWIDAIWVEGNFASLALTNSCETSLFKKKETIRGSN
jgi:hypothetical protein